MHKHRVSPYQCTRAISKGINCRGSGDGGKRRRDNTRQTNSRQVRESWRSKSSHWRCEKSCNRHTTTSDSYLHVSDIHCIRTMQICILYSYMYNTNKAYITNVSAAALLRAASAAGGMGGGRYYNEYMMYYTCKWAHTHSTGYTYTHAHVLVYLNVSLSLR